MTFQRALTPEQERALIVEHEDGWSINELSVIYRVSERTVYRLLSDYKVPKSNKRKRKARAARKRKPKELKPCGTNAAYQRHRRKGEYPCGPCLEAHAEDVQKAKLKVKRKVKG